MSIIIKVIFFSTNLTTTNMLQVVVEIAAVRAQVPSQQRGVGGENGGHVQVSASGNHQTHSGEPLVKVGDQRVLCTHLRPHLV